MIFSEGDRLRARAKSRAEEISDEQAVRRLAERDIEGSL